MKMLENITKLTSHGHTMDLVKYEKALLNYSYGGEVMKTERNIIVMALVIIIAISGQARAVTRHVPAQYPTIQSAIDAAANGDTVLVAPGTYKEYITIYHKTIDLRSSGGRDVTIINVTGLVDDEGKGHAAVVIHALMDIQCVLQGFTITGADWIVRVINTFFF